jgi:hypothetical protein
MMKADGHSLPDTRDAVRLDRVDKVVEQLRVLADGLSGQHNLPRFLLGEVQESEQILVGAVERAMLREEISVIRD